MKIATFTEFRRHAPDYLRRVETGESVRITRHGRPIADVVPPAIDEGDPSWKRPPQFQIRGLSLSRAVLDDRRKAKA